MSSVVYSIYAESYGEATLGLLPECLSLINLDTRVAEDTSAIVVSEIQDGFYSFDFNWEESKASAYLVKIDLDPSDTIFGDQRQRFVIMRIEKTDDTYNVVSEIKAASDSISANANLLSKYAGRLLEIESGSWKIESVNGEFILSLYGTGEFESGSQDQVLVSFALETMNGLPNYSNPAMRLKRSLLGLPQ